MRPFSTNQVNPVKKFTPQTHANRFPGVGTSSSRIAKPKWMAHRASFHRCENDDCIAEIDSFARPVREKTFTQRLGENPQNPRMGGINVLAEKYAPGNLLYLMQGDGIAISHIAGG